MTKQFSLNIENLIVSKLQFENLLTEYYGKAKIEKNIAILTFEDVHSEELNMKGEELALLFLMASDKYGYVKA